MINLRTTEKRFGTIIADPPWASESGGKNGMCGWSKTVGANAHYNVLTLKQIVEMGNVVQRICLPDAHMWLWVTNNILARGDHLDVVFSWGFRPVTITTWHKTSGYGMGQYLRGCTEHVVFCVRGRPPYARTKGKRVQGLTHFESPRGRHSEKPDQIHVWAEQISPGPRIELFARAIRPGWTCWGNEVDNAA